MSEYIQHKSKPRDPIFKEMIDKLKDNIVNYEDGQEKGKIRSMKTSCLRRFETFNNIKQINQFFTLYELCQNKQHREHFEKRDFVSGGDRTCFVGKDGQVCMIILHVRKSELDNQIFYRIARKLGIDVSFISSFKNPRQFTGVCFSKREEDIRSKVEITNKSVNIFRKLFKVCSRFSFGDIL